MRIKLAYTVLLVAVLPVSIASPVGAQAARAGAACLPARWEGRGLFLGLQSTVVSEWSALVGERWYVQRLQRSADNGDPRGRFEAVGLYAIDSTGVVRGQWFDSRGVTFPLAGRFSGCDLVIDWGGETSAERGRSTYRVTGDSLMTMTDSVSTPAGMRGFGGAQLRRKIAR